MKKSNSFRSLTRGLAKKKSKDNVQNGSPAASGPPKILKPLSLHDKKIVRALYDFSGSSDELNFKAGDDIIVVQEVVDDWWMGELPDGRKGLFPSSYTEVVGSKPALPERAKKDGPNATPQPSFLHPKSHIANTSNGGRDDGDTDDSSSHHDHSNDNDHYLASDADEEQIIRAVPMAANKSPLFYGGFNDTASLTESMTDDLEQDASMKNATLTKKNRHVFGSEDESDDNNWLSPAQIKQQYHPPSTIANINNPNALSVPLPSVQPKKNFLRSAVSTPGAGEAAHSPLIDRSQSDNPVVTGASNGNSLTSSLSGFFSMNSHSAGNNVAASGSSTPTKKPPPPPPPRRAASHNPPLGPPPAIPERKAPGASSGSYLSSSGASSGSLSALGHGLGHDTSSQKQNLQGYDRSPFDSAIDLELEDSEHEGGARTAVKCQQFRQNPFKPKGMCSNCLQFHD